MGYMGALNSLAGGSKPEKLAKAGLKPAAKATARAAGEPAAEPAKAVKRDARGRLVAGGANLNPGGRPKGREAELREMLERAGGDALLEGIIAGAVTLPSGEVQEVRDLRLRVETYRWAYERANGKALERSVSLNADLAGGEAAVPLDRVPEAVLGALLEASMGVFQPPEVPTQGVLEAGQGAQLGAQGAIIDAEITPVDLPATDYSTVVDVIPE